jgi:5-methylcytosine-specific restriction endonuclease McrA
MSPFRRCGHPTCSALVREGTGARCPRHQAAALAARRVYDRQRQTDPLHALYSTPEWRAFRARVLAARPTCVDCGRPATDVDHRIPVRAQPALAFVETNVDPRCHEDHSRRTSREHSWNRR